PANSMAATHSSGASHAPGYLRLYVNIDHVATVRQARFGRTPDPVAAALLCEEAGADGITAHLREDRRHIQDDDVQRLASEVRTVLNLEMADTDEMLRIALELRPAQVTLVPERREEITTEGGLQVQGAPERLRTTLARLSDAGIRTSLFIDPDPEAVAASVELGAAAIELHTGRYSHHPDDPAPLAALVSCALAGRKSGIAVHAGHGLTVQNVTKVAAIPQVEEL